MDNILQVVLQNQSNLIQLFLVRIIFSFYLLIKILSGDSFNDFVQQTVVMHTAVVDSER